MGSLPETTQAAKMLLFDFERPSQALRWRAVNDVVMGGVSTSQMRPLTDTTAVFEGIVSLENNGGFASVRVPVHQDLSACDGIRLRVRGDGREYGFFMRGASLLGAGIRYQASFHAPADAWATVTIPFDALAPHVWGMTLPLAPPLNMRHITAFGLILAGQPGMFRLELDWIRAVCEGR